MRIAALLLPCTLAACAVADLDDGAPAVDDAEPYASKLVVTLTGAPPAVGNIPNVTFTYTVSKPATVECRLDGAPYVACAVPSVSFTNLSSGQHAFDLRARAGSRKASIPTYTFTIDATPPVVAITSEPATLSNSSTATFAFTASGGTTSCSLDLAAPAPCTSPVSYAALADGTHVFRVDAVDPAGNVGVASDQWTIDATHPAVTGLSYSCDSTTGLVDVWWSVSDASGIASGACSYPAGVVTYDCTAATSWSGYLDGSASYFRVSYMDVAGNTATRTVRINTLACY